MSRRSVLNMSLCGMLCAILSNSICSSTSLEDGFRDHLVITPNEKGAPKAPSLLLISNKRLTDEEYALLKSTPVGITAEAVEEDLKNRVFPPLSHIKIEKALEGDKFFQGYIGHIYRMAIVNPKRDEHLLTKALQWLLTSLRDDDGDGNAEVELFSLYLHQKGNRPRAEFWMNRALEKGSRQAKEYFGEIPQEY